MTNQQLPHTFTPAAKGEMVHQGSYTDRQPSLLQKLFTSPGLICGALSLVARTTIFAPRQKMPFLAMLIACFFISACSEHKSLANDPDSAPTNEESDKTKNEKSLQELSFLLSTLLTADKYEGLLGDGRPCTVSVQKNVETPGDILIKLAVERQGLKMGADLTLKVDPKGEMSMMSPSLTSNRFSVTIVEYTAGMENLEELDLSYISIRYSEDAVTAIWLYNRLADGAAALPSANCIIK